MVGGRVEGRGWREKDGDRKREQGERKKREKE